MNIDQVLSFFDAYFKVEFPTGAVPCGPATGCVPL